MAKKTDCEVNCCLASGVICQPSGSHFTLTIRGGFDPDLTLLLYTMCQSVKALSLAWINEHFLLLSEKKMCDPVAPIV